MKEQKGYFSSTGSYGCVHYPRIKCNGTHKSFHPRLGARLSNRLLLIDWLGARVLCPVHLSG